MSEEQCGDATWLSLMSSREVGRGKADEAYHVTDAQAVQVTVADEFWEAPSTW